MFVWAYALAWFLVNDRVKLLAYRILDPAVPPPSVKKSIDSQGQIADRAFQLYEQRGRRKGDADQDWLQAEQEIRQKKSQAK